MESPHAAANVPSSSTTDSVTALELVFPILPSDNR